MNDPIRIRPLHFVDILCDYGAGTEVFEPHPFGHAVHTVANQMIADRDTPLEITLEPDAICIPCVHNVDNLCDNLLDRTARPTAPVLMRDWDLAINQRWCKRLGLAEGDRLTARQFAERLRDRRGDINEIFPEFIDNRIEIKARNLTEGIRKFLQ